MKSSYIFEISHILKKALFPKGLEFHEESNFIMAIFLKA